jgi:hypothetical protein
LVFVLGNLRSPELEMAGEPLDHLRSMAHARKFKPSSSGEEKIGRGAPGVSNIHYCVINHPKT